METWQQYTCQGMMYEECSNLAEYVIVEGCEAEHVTVQYRCRGCAARYLNLPLKGCLEKECYYPIADYIMEEYV